MGKKKTDANPQAAKPDGRTDPAGPAGETSGTPGGYERARPPRGPDWERRVEEETVILEITERLCDGMAACGIDARELARRARLDDRATRRALEGRGRTNLRTLIRLARVVGLAPRLVPAGKDRTG